MPNTFVIFNPVAGTEEPERVYDAIASRLATQAGSYDIYRTTGDERVLDVVKKALRRGFDVFVAAGGDGTVSNTASGLVDTGKSLGILPTGTGNVLARELGIPLQLNAALELLTGEHTIRPIDTMKVDDRYFILSISVGLSSLTMQDTGREEKRMLGLTAYVWTGIQKLLGFQPIGFELTLDGEETYRRADEVAVANNGALGMPAFRWGPEVTLDDGTLDVCFVDARNLLDYLSIAWNAFWGQQRQERRMHCLQAKERVTVTADRDLPVQADGDIIARQSVEVEIAPQSLDLIVPPED